MISILKIIQPRKKGRQTGRKAGKEEGKRKRRKREGGALGWKRKGGRGTGTEEREGGGQDMREERTELS